MIGKIVSVVFVLAAVGASLFLLYPSQADRFQDKVDVAKADLQVRAVQARNSLLGEQVTPEMESEKVAAQANLAAVKFKKEVKEVVRDTMEDMSLVISVEHDSRLVRGYRVVFWNGIPLIGAVTRAYDRFLDYILNCVGARGTSEVARTVVKLAFTVFIILAMLSPFSIFLI